MANHDPHAQAHVPIRHGSMLPGNGLAKQVTTALLIALCSGSLGFGASQMFVVTKVNGSMTDIGYLKLADVQILAAAVEDRNRTDQRINKLVETWEKSTDLTRELVQLVKVQNELLARDRK